MNDTGAGIRKEFDSEDAREEVFTKIKSIVLEFTAHNAVVLTRDTRLYEDLGVYGDDAVELLVLYGKTFNVYMKKFYADQYFEGEGWDIDVIRPIVRLFNPNWKPKSAFKPLTLGHLEKGVLAGRLDEEVIMNH